MGVRIIGTLAALALAALLWRIDHVAGQLAAEKTAHAVTAGMLETMTGERDRWIEAYQEALSAAEAQRKNAQACLDREAKARTDAEERAAIMSQVRPGLKPQQDTVIDDETRRRIVDRLNRAL